MHRHLVPLLIATGASTALLSAPAHAAAKTVPWDFQMQVSSPLHTDEHTGRLPLLMTGRQRVKVGRKTYVGPPNNFVSTPLTFDLAMDALRADDFPMQSAFADRPLTATEQRRYVEAATLYTDADVLVVAGGHPACGGVSKDQARAIATGAISNWQAIFPDTDDQPISVRYRETETAGAARFGVQYTRVDGRMTPNWAPGAAPDSTGGVNAAAYGDRAIAAFTGYSHLPAGIRETACIVPIDGIAPTNATVTSRAYPAAFRVTYVTAKRKPPTAVDRAWRSRVTKFMSSPTVKNFLRGRGVLVAGDPVPADR